MISIRAKERPTQVCRAFINGNYTHKLSLLMPKGSLKTFQFYKRMLGLYQFTKQTKKGLIEHWFQTWKDGFTRKKEGEKYANEDCYSQKP